METETEMKWNHVMNGNGNSTKNENRKLCYKVTDDMTQGARKNNFQKNILKIS